MPSVTSQPSRATSTAVRRTAAKAVGVGDHVVGGERAHHGVGVAALEQRGRQADRGHRVARRRLREHGVRAEVRAAGRARPAVRPPGDDQEPVAGQRRQPVDGVPEQRAAAAGQVVEELRRDERDSGHSRVPAPPAGITAQKSSMAFLAWAAAYDAGVGPPGTVGPSQPARAGLPPWGPPGGASVPVREGTVNRPDRVQAYTRRSPRKRRRRADPGRRGRLAPGRRARAVPERGRLGGRGRPRRPRRPTAAHCPVASRTTCCCWTGCCPGSTASRCAAGCATLGRDHAGADAHRPRRRARPHRRPRRRRRRLPAQAVRPRRAAGPAAGAAPPHRRTTSEAPSQVDDLVVDPAVAPGPRAGHGEIELSAREFDILHLLVARAGQVVTRFTILDEVWDGETDLRSNVIDVHLASIRAKIDRPFGTDHDHHAARRGLPASSTRP